MLGQQIITKTGVKTKFDLAIQRLKAFEPPKGIGSHFRAVRIANAFIICARWPELNLTHITA